MTADVATARQVSQTMDLDLGRVSRTLELLADGATVPFIARYRKEHTGGLDEVQIREIRDHHEYFNALSERKVTILSAIAEQGQLSEALRQQIQACTNKTELEDLYLPYKPKRRTRASVARERGLEPLALRILAQPRHGDALSDARQYLDPARDLQDVDAVLAGARDIVAEQIAERAELRALVRETITRFGELSSAKKKAKVEEPTKFEQYYDYRERVDRAPAHRIQAIFRGEREGVLKVALEVDQERTLGKLLREIRHFPNSPFADQLLLALQDSFKRLLYPSVEKEVRSELKARSDRESVAVFASNLGKLLLAAPYGGKPVLGIDPGIRTGCKCAAVDQTGQFLAHETIFLSRGARESEAAAKSLLRLVRQHQVAAIAVGNGTHGRETEGFVRETLAAAGDSARLVVLVSEAGASVYSASDVAREEFPELDLTVRGAISIARRLQDPLAELVKIDPKSIGVGQYQHDVDQKLLQAALVAVVEDCVNSVGVELNTASAPLLSYVSGVGSKLALRIVAHRDRAGRFKTRRELLDVAGLGAKTFEQAAGFLRIRGGKNPLDGSAVHPERYRLVERLARDLGCDLSRLVGNAPLAASIDLHAYVDHSVGLPTLKDIVAELTKPGRDPRSGFEAPSFRDDVRSIEDLREGMSLSGVVTNVTAFGAFVDVGVKQDGLVHISQLADRFVRDASEVVSVGDRLQVRVLEVDLKRKRISLSAKTATDKR